MEKKKHASATVLVYQRLCCLPKQSEKSPLAARQMMPWLSCGLR